MSRRLAIAHAISISKIYFCVSRAAVGEEEAVTDGAARTLRALADKLNEQEIETPRGGQRGPSSVHNLLARIAA